MTLTANNVRDSFIGYVQTDDLSPLFFRGDAQAVLSQLPDASVDFCMTSPPYWGKRDIMPEDTQKRGNHFAPYPEDLCKIPLLATCPPDGLVLDPFCGTGTTMLAARKLWRKSVGIDISPTYLEIAEERCNPIVEVVPPEGMVEPPCL
jgi:DNA modification methylase